MTGWTPLHQRIVASSVWSTKYHVRIAWVTLLAITGKDGIAHVTLGGLARMANILPEEAADALKVLSAPDEDTMTQENEGRRIERVATGWRLLNWDTYRVLAQKGIVQEQNRAAQARWRDKDREKSSKSLALAARGQGEGAGKESTPPVQPPLARVRASNRPGSVEEVIEAGKMLGVGEALCRKFWNKYESTARHDENDRAIWMTGKTSEQQVGNWRNLLAAWKATEDENRGSDYKPQRAPKEHHKEPGQAPVLLVQTFSQPAQENQPNP